MPNAALIAEAIRFHWEVENKAHWVLDVVYREDDFRIRRGNGTFGVGLVRRLCMNLARLHPAKESVRGKLKDAALDDDFRPTVTVWNQRLEYAVALRRIRSRHL